MKVLKPIYLGQDEPTRILDHGNKWLFTINRLKEKLPPDVVVAVEGPIDSLKVSKPSKKLLICFVRAISKW